MTACPKTVSVLGQLFSVSFVDTEEIGGAGLMDPTTRAISCATGQHPFDERDTVLHEAFHAILFRQGRDNDGKTEEVYVRALATGALQVLRDNPALTRWLLSK